MPGRSSAPPRPGIPTEVFDAAAYPDREARDAAIAGWLVGHGVELVVLAGYMHVLQPRFFEVFGRKVVNTHGAPLPEFPGAHPIEDVLAAGVAQTAATVHWSTKASTRGP